MGALSESNLCIQEETTQSFLTCSPPLSYLVINLIHTPLAMPLISFKNKIRFPFAQVERLHFRIERQGEAEYGVFKKKKKKLTKQLRSWVEFHQFSTCSLISYRELRKHGDV